MNIQAILPCLFCLGPGEHIHLSHEEEVIACVNRNSTCLVGPSVQGKTIFEAVSFWNDPATFYSDDSEENKT